MLKIEKISFSYLKKPTLKRLSFAVEKGHNFAVIGESGCGKSTLLKLIYGMFDLDEGKISYDGKPILGPKFNLIPGEDYIKYLAQDFDLMPYITVAENVGKFLSNTNKNKKDTRVNELLEMVEMTPFATVKAQYLSGGQMQRVAIARVLALEPEILLLDEPFSHIDNFRRSSLSRKLFAYLREKQITCIVATHDSSDVLSFADSVMIMKDGESVEMGSPTTIHHHPKNKYVASFFGDVNEIPSHFIIENSQSWEPLFIYPHELVVAVDSVLKVTTKKSYFRGSYYLIESVYENGTLFFQSEIDFPEDTIVFLKRKA
jgi:ABC-type Fe3+/spermidine/putrescine transport system ATPase subunit